MSGFRDPYANRGADYMRHNNYDSTDHNYDNYGYNPYQEHQQSRQEDPESLERSYTTASHYSNTSAPREQEGMKASDSNRTLHALPEAQEPGYEFPSMGPGGEGGSNLLRKGTNRLYTATSDLRHSLTPLTRPPGKSASDIKRWRRDYHGNLWTKGSRGSCIARFCCCTIMIALLLLISIVLALVMWVRPPDIQFTGIQTNQNGSTFEATTNQTFKINLGFGINVTNPNYFSASFTSIEADLFYPINNTDVGGGLQKDITFNAHSVKDFIFPFSFVYSKSVDPQGAIITDIVNRCGIIDPSTKKDISVQYKITLRFKVLVATIGPSFGGSANFECPLEASEIKPFLGGLGINIPGLNS